MGAGFVKKLTNAIERNNSLLCVGLDPDLSKISDNGGSEEERLVRWGTEIVEKTVDLVCCFKPNFAFYEQYGLQGLSALRKILAAVPDDVKAKLDEILGMLADGSLDTGLDPISGDLLGAPAAAEPMAAEIGT